MLLTLHVEGDTVLGDKARSRQLWPLGVYRLKCKTINVSILDLEGKFSILQYICVQKQIFIVLLQVYKFSYSFGYHRQQISLICLTDVAWMQSKHLNNTALIIKLLCHITEL